MEASHPTGAKSPW